MTGSKNRVHLYVNTKFDRETRFMSHKIVGCKSCLDKQQPSYRTLCLYMEFPDLELIK